MEILYVLLGLVIGMVLVWLLFRQKIKATEAGSDVKLEKATAAWQNEKSEIEKQLEVLKERLSNAGREQDMLSQKLDQSEKEKQEAEKSRAVLQADYRHLEEKLREGQQELEKIQEKFKKDFELLAQSILKQNTREFNETSHKQMKDLLDPLRDKITDFEKKVEETYQKGKIDQTVLKEELKRLQEMNMKLGEEASNLTKALKSDSKKQGNWGEVVLERILERSGLIKDEEYFVQFTASGADGKTLRPDVLIKLPEEKHLIIDSKVSLTAFQQYISQEDEEKRNVALKQHLTSIKNHIKELSDKNYDQLGGLNTPDFVLMFMPVEPAFAVAVQADPELFNEAWEKRIVIVSPTTLLATLRTVASIWRHERQTRNALEIAGQGAKLYEKFVGFMEDLEKVGLNLERAQNSYRDAHKKLVSGRGNLVGQVEKLKALGLKTTKNIDQKYLDE